MVLTADFSRHAAGTVRGLLALKIIAVIQLDLLDAVEPPHEIEVPVAPAELAVRNHMVAECLLLPDQIRDTGIFHLAKLLAGNLSRIPIGSRLL